MTPRTGRPPKPAAERRSVNKLLTLTPREWADLRAAWREWKRTAPEGASSLNDFIRARLGL